MAYGAQTPMSRYRQYTAETDISFLMYRGMVFFASARFVVANDATRICVLDPPADKKVLIYAQYISVSAGPLLTRRMMDVSYTAGTVTDQSVANRNEAFDNGAKSEWYADATGVSSNSPDRTTWDMTGGGEGAGNRPIGGFAPGHPQAIITTPYAIEISNANLSGADATTNSDAQVTVGLVFAELDELDV